MNETATPVVAPQMGLLNFKETPERVASAIGEELAIGAATGFSNLANEGAMVNLGLFAPEAAAPTVTVVTAVVTVQAVPAGRLAVRKVKVREASATPLLAYWSPKSDLPHFAVGAVVSEKLHEGRATVSVSLVVMITGLVKTKVIADAAPAKGFATVMDVPDCATIGVAVEVGMAVAGTFDEPVMVAATVRVGSFAS